MSRVSLLLVVLACLFTVQPSWASQPDFHLQVVPGIVYKVDDPGNTKTSSFLFDIAVICSTDCGLTPISARVELSSAGSTVERQDWTTEMLAKIQRVNYRILCSSSPFTVTALLGRTGARTAAMAVALALTSPSTYAAWMRTMRNRKTMPTRTLRLRAGAARS